MHIVENCNNKSGRVYCYVAECIWNKDLKKYEKPRVSVGHLEGDPPVFVPNKTFEAIMHSEADKLSSTGKHEQDIINTVKEKYGNSAVTAPSKSNSTNPQTARAIFIGPSIVFGGITSRYHIALSHRHNTEKIFR